MRSVTVHSPSVTIQLLFSAGRTDRGKGEGKKLKRKRWEGGKEMVRDELRLKEGKERLRV